MNYKNIIWKTLKKLGNLNLSIVLLLTIACLSIIGTIIEQEQSSVYYQTNYPIQTNHFLEFNWKIILFLHLNHLYTSTPFICLLILFCTSLLICTLSTQLPSLKHSRQWKIKKYIQNKDEIFIKYNKNINNPSFLIYQLNNTHYYVFHQNISIYSYKGISGRIAPIFVHFSIIFILLGSIVGLFTGFLSQEMIPNGEIFHLQNITKSGQLSFIPNNLIGQINNFHIEYYPNQNIKQFYSTLSIKSKQQQIINQSIISVNKPLKFQQLTFYQTDWQINALRLKIGLNNPEYIQLPLEKISYNNRTVWITMITYNNNKQLIFILSSLNNKINCYNQNGEFIKNILINKTTYIDHIAIKAVEIMTSTGLQIKKDPGIQLIFLSFFILIISIILSYISYSQIWITFDNSQIKLLGSTNRAKLNFEEEMWMLNKAFIKHRNN